MYCRNYFVHYFDVGEDRKATIISIIKYLEDLAILQSEENGVGLDHYEKTNTGWMLYKWDIKMHRYPDFQETVKVCTEPYAFKGFYANRRFRIFDANDNLLCEAESLWIFINTETRRPSRVSPDMYKGYGLTEKDDKINKLKELETFDEPEEKKSFNVRMSDIDTNGHVNNKKYIEWILETIPPGFRENKFLYNLKVTYKKETTYGAIIEAGSSNLTKEGYDEGSHQVTCKGKALCLAKTFWKAI